MKKIFLLLWFVLLGLFEVQAYQFEKNGIYYDIVNGKAVVVSNWSTGYTGDMVIPETVEYSGQVYVVDSIGSNAFDNCGELTSVRLPEGLKAIGEYAFSSCSGLTSISFPGSLRHIGEYAFSSCSGLTFLSFPEGMTEIGKDAFRNCGRLETLSFPSTMKSIDWSVFCDQCEYEWEECTCDSIKRVEVKDIATWFNSNRIVGNHNLVVARNADLYVDGKLLTEVVLPDTMIRIRPALFYGCKKLHSVVFSKNLKVIGSSAFRECTGIESLNFPQELDSIEGLAFANCENLVNINFPDRLKSIGGNAFNGCKSLAAVAFPEGLTEIENGAFEGCKRLTSLVFPEGLREIGERAFLYCDNLDSLSFPTSMKTINWSAFCLNYTWSTDEDKTCNHIRYVNVKDLLTWVNSERGYKEDESYNHHLRVPHAQLYLDGTLLTEVVIPEGVEEIKPCTFYGMDSLALVKLPTSIKKIGVSAFNNQGVELELYALVPPQRVDMYSLGENLVYVPESCIEAYRTAWSDKVNDILCLERQHDWDVTVEAEEKSSAVLQAVGGVSDNEAARNVVRLKVSGTVNSYDFMVMRNKMTSLRELDLTDAHVVYNPYEHYQGYHSWNDSLPDYAFYRKELRVCKLPQSITYIGQSAFSECRKLTGMDIPEKVQEIGYAAFTGCNCLKEVEFHEGLERIGSEGFSNCALQDTIVFPQTLKHISYNAFGMNGSLKAVKFPVGLESIESSAFNNCSGLSEVRFPASVLSVGSDAFMMCDNIKDVYTYIIDPLQLDQTTFSAEVFKNAMLHVPETAQNNYYWDTQWSQFPSIVMFNEPYEYFYLNKDLVIDEETPRLEGDTIPGTGEVQGPDADLNPGSGLVVEGSESQDLGDVHLKDDGNGNGASVIGQGDKDGHCNINAKNLHIDIQVEANRWYFFCFPYPIDKKNIKYAGSYVLRWYDGAERAQHGRGGWKDWAADKLTAGVGYIFQGSQSGTLTFQVPDAKFDGENRDILLQSHGADEVQDAGWNFVGNPYTSYFDLQDLGYDYPVTIWNGWSYEAYNPQDDDYVLYPYQAFFVQKPNAEDGITFHAAHRKTKLQSEAARRANVAPRRMRRAAGVEHRLVNLTLSDGKVTDKTRVVFNARKRETYEVGCDAAKFMAEGVPQLYSLDGQGVKYAINERPEGNGVVSLGYEVQAAGNYTIGLTRADVGVMLKDKLTGASHDFSEGDYVFSSEAGTFHDRFLLVKSASATGVNGVFAAGEAVVDVENGTIAVSGAAGLRTTVTALSGILMGTIDGNGSLDVRPGVYVVNVGGQARKVVVR
ncbi:leucine-rich repeat protein [Paraprevotella xylaniphila]|uniref:leucine-rich repeat protein n=1 Tax=Paraprevotella xylaniphila TaxID=454155 RepID=UPI0039F5FE62